jgi:fructan beta-fructosidase
VDHNNTSGLGTDGSSPLVAVFTYHDTNKEQEGNSDYQTQGIAYSNDNGETWEKYTANPVIPNEEFRDFRDPKVFWHEDSRSWILVLVAGDHARLYRSPDLLKWEYISEFGRDKGAHGGVWECPDLFPLKVEGSGEEKWVLIISINPGAPNGGSGTQYFIGSFNGSKFTSNQKDTRWLDWGTDNYAGVTYNDVPSGERIFIGWMSNWAYAVKTPTEKWRSAMTVPRKLSLRQTGDTISLINYPLENLATILKPEGAKNLEVPRGAKDSVSYTNFNQSEVRFMTASRDFSLTFGNDREEALVLTMDGDEQIVLLDRSRSGKTDFEASFGQNIQRMPISNIPEGMVEVRLLLDASSVELFINGGQYVMTAQLFPNSPYTKLDIENKGDEPFELQSFEVSGAESIW